MFFLFHMLIGCVMFQKYVYFPVFHIMRYKGSLIQQTTKIANQSQVYKSGCQPLVITGSRLISPGDILSRTWLVIFSGSENLPKTLFQFQVRTKKNTETSPADRLYFSIWSDHKTVDLIWINAVLQKVFICNCVCCLSEFCYIKYLNTCQLMQVKFL